MAGAAAAAARGDGVSQVWAALPRLTAVYAHQWCDALDILYIHFRATFEEGQHDGCVAIVRRTMKGSDGNMIDGVDA